MSSRFPNWWTSWSDPHWEDPRYRKALDLLEVKSPEKRVVRDWMLRYLGSPPGHFVDIGSGTGFIPQGFVKEGWTVTLLDSDPGTAEGLRGIFSEPHRVVEADILAANGAASPLIEKAQLVAMTHMLYHIPRRRWPEAFTFAHSLLAPGGKMVIALRSPREYFNGLCADLGAQIFDVELDAAKWAEDNDIPFECHELKMSHHSMKPDEVLVLAQFLLRDMAEDQFLQPVPDLDELAVMIERDLFENGRCVWPYENSLVVLGKSS